MSNHGENNCGLSTVRRGDSRIIRHKNLSGGNDYVIGREPITYRSRKVCLEALVQKMALYPKTIHSQYNASCNYTTVFNSWLMATGVMRESVKTTSYARIGYRESYCGYTRELCWQTNEGLLIVRAKSESRIKNEAKNSSCWKIFMAIKQHLGHKMIGEYPVSNEYTQMRGINQLPRVQMEQPEKLTNQGDPTQESDKQVNTIITRDQQETKSEHSSALDSATSITSTEKLHDFKSITSRWMPLKVGEISVSQDYDTALEAIYLPEALYTSSQCAPNIIPFETFIYGRMDIEIRVVVNANKFHCGKLVVSSKYDSYQADNVQVGVQSALQRNHIILDLCANNEGILQIPFRYHRSFVRLLKNDSSSVGIRPSKYATVNFHILSPLKTGPDGPSTISYRTFYRLKNSKFTGMSYRVSVQGESYDNRDFYPHVATVQMNNGLELVTPVVKGVKKIIKDVEDTFDQIGETSNQDKPGKVNGTIVIPKPRWNFGTGKGIIDVQPMRVNPHTLTNYGMVNVPTDEPKSFEDLARIWGPYKRFPWRSNDSENTVIADIIIDPTSRSYDSIYVGELTPIEYALSNYVFYSGTIELRFDFVSNSFHTGMVQISIEYGRTTGVSDVCGSASTYTKNFHLGEQKSVSLRVPYIYDTPFRRTTELVYNPYGDEAGNDEYAKRSLTVAPLSKTRVKVRVLNVLKPIETTTQEIEVIVFIRGGKNFTMHGLKASTYIMEYIRQLDDFPYQYAPIQPGSRKKRETIDEAKRRLDAKLLPLDMRNEWNEYKSDKLALARVQMDNGEKEDVDPTDNFSEGPSISPLTTLDNQTNFKDLLRRPTLLCRQVEVKALSSSNDGFCIPCLPPTKDICTSFEVNNKDNSIFACSLKFTSAVSIMDMFRCYRGGMRYTIVAYGATKPFYVTQIPHTGTRWLGNNKFSLSDNMIPIYGSNFNTELVVPTVNPTTVIEVPYDTENIWSLTFCEDATRNFSWRDFGDYNIGHLVISAYEDIKLDVWWSAADDFEISNFYGVPKLKTKGYQFRFSDIHARVQMDFQDNEVNTPVSNFSRIKKYIPSMKDSARLLIGAVPGVGPGIAMATFGNELMHKADTVVDSVSETNRKLQELSVQAQCSLLDLTTLVSEAVKGVSGTLASIVNGTAILTDFILDLLMAWMEKSWRIVGFALVKFVGKFLLTSENLLSGIMIYVNDFTEFLTHQFGSVVFSVQAPSTASTITGILIGLVGTCMGVTLDSNRRRNWPGALFERITHSQGIQYLVGVLRFVQGIFDTVKILVLESLGYVSPELKALKLLGEQNEQIDAFIREAQIVTSEVNGSLVLVPQFRLRFWKCVLQAYQYQRLLARIPSNQVHTLFSKLCYDVIKMAQEKFLDISSSPVRYEPFVICIEGSSGIGKSFMTEQFACNLLESIGYNNPSVSSIYYRSSGDRFWSGYRDQPIVVYDEFLNMRNREKCTEQLAELFKLKSTSLFIPEMAHLEEKKIRGNPLIVIILTNDAFPNVSDYVTHSEAILRRRDLVLRAELRDEYKGKNLRSETITNFEHLMFKIFTDPSKKNTLTQTGKTYLEMKDFVTKKIIVYNKQELLHVKARTDQALRFLQRDDDDVLIQDPFTLFYKLNAHLVDEPVAYQNVWTPAEKLEFIVDQMNRSIREGEMRLRQEQEIQHDEFEDLDDWVDSPEVQGIGSFICGFALSSGLLTKLLNYSKEKLVSLEERIWSNIKPERECVICREVVPISYVCDSTKSLETPHSVCSLCYQGMLIHTRANCPVCRDPNMTYAFTKRTWAELTLCQRLVAVGAKSTSWFVEKILQLLNWRRDNMLTTIVIDFLLEVILTQHHVINNLSSCFIAELRGEPYEINLESDRSLFQGLHIGRMTFLNMHRLQDWFPQVSSFFVQSDDWPDPEASTSVTPFSNFVREEDSEDHFNPEINEEILNDYKTRGDNLEQPCVHNILKNSVNRLTLIGETWRVNDRKTCQLIDVPVEKCNSNHCIVQEPVYHQIIENYMIINRVELRNLYYNYALSPTLDNLNVIPKLFRTRWMNYQPVVIKETWWEWVSEKYERYKNMIFYLGGITIAIGSLIKLYMVISQLSNGVQGGSVGSPEASPQHTRPRFARSVGPRYFQSATQSLETPSVKESAMMDIEKNTFKIEICRSNDKVLTLYGVGLFGHVLLIPRHYVQAIIKAIKQQHMIYGSKLLHPQTRHKINFTIEDFKMSDDADIAYCTLPTSFELFKDIRKKIAKEQDIIGKYQPSHGTLLVVPGKNTKYMREVEVELDCILDEIQVADMDNQTFTARDVIKYNYSQPGACGSLLLIDNNQRPIIGMHFAGYGETGQNGDGMAVILTQEALGFLAHTQGPCTIEDKLFLPYEEHAILKFDEETQIIPIGAVETKDIPYIPRKSKLVKSLIYGTPGLETSLEPAILSKEDPRWIHQDTPLLAGCKAHGKLTLDFTSSELKFAKQALWDGWYCALSANVANPRPLTIEEAIVGLPNIPYYKAIDLNTSAGYPYMLTNRKSKEDYITVIRDEQQRIVGVSEVDKIVLNEIERKQTLRKQGIVPHTIFIDTLKDEKKKKEKVMKYGGTRVFCNSPLDYVIECRQKFMHFIAAFMQSRHKLMHAVGINVMSEEWTKLTNNLLRNNTNFVTIDYTNFGPGYNAGVAEQAYNIMIDWVMREIPSYDRVELECIVQECLQSEHIMHNTVYRQTSGSPSGAVFTTVINTMVNQLYILLAWKSIMSKWCLEQNTTLIKAFQDNVTLYAYGDDAILSINDRVLEYFNGQTIHEYFKQYNIVSTSADKTGTIQKTEKFSEATFLKRGFKPHPTRRGKFLSPLNWNSLVGATQWVWSSSNDKVATFVNAEAALLQAHGYGPEKFEEFKQIVNKALKKKKIKTVTYNWQELDLSLIHI